MSNRLNRQCVARMSDRLSQFGQLHAASDRKLIGVFILLFLLSALTGCATHSPIGQLDRDAELSFHLHDANNSADSIKLMNQEVNKKSTEYGSTAALAGATAGLSCGPWFIVCSPVAMFLGGMVGGTAGLVVGASAELDNDTRTLIINNLKDALESDPLDQQILDATVLRSGSLFTVIDDSTTNRLKLQLAKIRLHSSDEGVSMLVDLVAELAYQNEENEEEIKRDMFTYQSAPLNLESWTNADQSFYQQLFSATAYYFSEKVAFSLLKENSTK